MIQTARRIALAATAAVALALKLPAAGSQPASQDLPSWSDGPAKKAITAFVARVSQEGGADYVPPEKRIAVFDNDGTLWAEQPVYVQLAFAFDRVKALSNRHPEWKRTQPFQAVLDNDFAALAKSGEKGLVELIMATHAGTSTQDFEEIVSGWIGTARHPKFERPYTELVYQPMLELLAYLRANGFKTFIVSGGGVEFMRPWTERVYAVPPEQVVGSSIKTKYQVTDGKPELIRLPEMNFVDDKAGKPVGINAHIGRRPIAAFGNSDGDLEMLEWATAVGGARLGMIVHHDNAADEYAYDRKSAFGKLDKGLDEAPKKGWTIISMKDDWRCVFAFQCGGPGSGE